MITFHRVSKNFDGHEVLKNISFDVDKGELVAVIGKSGVGKSTLIHMLMGAEKPDEGDIAVGEFLVSGLSAKELQKFRQTIGVVFQDFKLLPQKTVFENVAFALEVVGEKEHLMERKVAEALHIVGLERLHNRFPSLLSGGEKQRVAIARAMVHSPQFLIADEPTGNLDPENTSSIAQLFQKLNKENDVTVLVTTHDPAFVAELRPRILVIEEGKITQDLDAGALFPRY